MRHLKKYKDLTLFLWRYGNSDLITQSGLMGSIDLDEADKEKAGNTDLEKMVKDLQELGPTFIKLGQLLSTRPDLLPEPYIEALSHLQNDLDAFPFEEVEQIVRDELGVRISKAFNRFDSEPVAAASLGQVHMAEMRNGNTVVVKVQRPGIRKKVLEELEILDDVSGFLEKNTTIGKKFELNKLLNHFKTTLLRELNYLKEAEHMNILGKNLAEFKNIVIPAAVADYTTDKVLTMEFIKGTKITKISPLKKLEMDGEGLCDELFRCYLKQIVVDGFMHADPHPGNVHLTEDNKIALLDMGMIAHLSNDLRENYLKLLLHISENDADEVVNILLKMSRSSEDADEENFRILTTGLIQENHDASVDEIDTGRAIFAIISIAGQCGYHLPIELSSVGKAMLNLDRVAHTLAPGFNPNKAIRKNAMSLMNKHMYKDLAPENFFSTLLEGKEFLEKLPERLNKIVGNIADNKIRVEVDAFDEKHMMQGFQKVANRITLGLILASLVVGSALMMRVPTDFQLFGYPGLGILAFLIAAIGALGLAIHIFFYDES